jgi:hypothetical protein
LTAGDVADGGSAEFHHDARHGMRLPCLENPGLRKPEEMSRKWPRRRARNAVAS